jgi:hypothetical protein
MEILMPFGVAAVYNVISGGGVVAIFGFCSMTRYV